MLTSYKPRGYKKIPITRMTLRSRSEAIDANNYKDRVNAHLLVATLVATITFDACITVPGGFDSSGPDLGKAILAKN